MRWNVCQNCLCMASKRYESPCEGGRRTRLLPGHDTVENNIDGWINKRQNVHQLPKVSVTFVEKCVAKDTAEQGKNSLRKFRQQKEENNGQEHPRRPVVFPSRLPEAPSSSETRDAALCLESIAENHTRPFHIVFVGDSRVRQMFYGFIWVIKYLWRNPLYLDLSINGFKCIILSDDSRPWSTIRSRWKALS